jgi:hypothetical protein
MPRPTLPHRARGIEGENFALQFLADKIVIVPRSAAEGEHYTFHAGPDSGVLDLHETHMSSGRSEQHRTLFAMRRDDLPAALGAMTPVLSELLALLRPLRLGWLKHHGIGIALGSISSAMKTSPPQRTSEKAGLQSTGNSMKPIFSCRSFWRKSTIFRTETSPCSAVVAGSASASRPPWRGGGDVRLAWIKLTDLMRFGRSWEPKVMSTLASFAIPPERYADFPPLQR